MYVLEDTVTEKDGVATFAALANGFGLPSGLGKGQHTIAASASSCWFYISAFRSMQGPLQSWGNNLHLRAF